MFLFFKKIFYFTNNSSISKRDIINYICLIDNFKLQKHFVSKAYNFYLNNPDATLGDIRKFLINSIGFEKYLFLKIRHSYLKEFKKELSDEQISFLKTYLNKLNYFDPVLFDANDFINQNFKWYYHYFLKKIYNFDFYLIFILITDYQNFFKEINEN